MPLAFTKTTKTPLTPRVDSLSKLNWSGYFMLTRFGCICALLAEFLLVSSAAADPAPKFSDFGVTNIVKGKPADVDLSSHPKARRYRTQLRVQTAEGANFAGHYRLAKWGSGTGCAEFARSEEHTS